MRTPRFHLAILFSWLLLAVACAPQPVIEPDVTREPATKPANTAPPATAPSATARAENTATPHATAPPLPGAAAEAPGTLAVGAPNTLGRGLRDAAFGPDGETLAVGWTGGISLVEVASQAELWFHETGEMVTALDTSGAYIAAVLVDGTVWLLDTATGEGKQFPQALLPDSYWGDVAWSPDGKLAAIQAIRGAGSRGSPLVLLDPQTGSLRELPDSHTDGGYQPALHWSPDSTLLAAADRKGNGWVWDVAEGEVVYQATPGEEGVRTRIYGWLPDSRTALLSVSQPPDLQLFDVRAGETVRELSGARAGFGPSVVLVAPDGSTVLAGGHEPAQYQIMPYLAWDLETGQALDVPPVAEQRHVSRAGCMILTRPAAHFDGERLLYVDSDGRIVQWALGVDAGDEIGRLPVAYPCLGTPLLWSPDSTRLALHVAPGDAIAVWDVAGASRVALREDGTFPAALAGDLLAYRGETGDLLLYDLATAEMAATLPGPVSHLNRAVAFSPEADRLAYGVGGEVVIAGVPGGETVATLNGDGDVLISQIVWSPDGNALVAAAVPGDGNSELPGPVVLWQQTAAGWREVARTASVRAGYDLGSQTTALFNPAGTLVALEQMPSFDAGAQSVVVYDLEANALAGERSGATVQQWLSDAVLLLTESSGWTRYFEWQPRTGEEEGLGSSATQAELGAYTPDKRYHASFTGRPPRSVAIREWRSGKMVATTTVYLGSDVQDMAFSPDGRWLVVRGTEGLVKVWPIVDG